MPRIISVCIILCLPVLAVSAAFQIPAGHLAFAEPVVREILDCRFDNALQVTDTAADGNPIAAVLHLTALGMRDIDFDTTVDAAAFAQSFERALAVVGRYEDIYGASSYSNTLRGVTLGIYASYHLKNKSYRLAGSSGMESVRVIREARIMDSTNAEGNFFLGMYDYARTELKRRLWWILFWYPGGKTDGIRLLEEGARNAVIMRVACALALSDIYLNEKQPRRAREIIYNLKKEFPQSRFVLWAEAKYFENQKMYTHAAQTYGRLADMYELEKYGARNGAETRNRQADMHKKGNGR